MKPIEKDELYAHLGGFLKAKGIQMTDGSYSQGIQKACAILTDTINLSQRGLERAKEGIDRNLQKVRQVIHEKTAPGSKTSAAKSSAPPPKAKAAPKPTSARKPVKPGKPGGKAKKRS